MNWSGPFLNTSRTRVFVERTVPAACHCRQAFPRSCRAGIAQPRAGSLGQAPCAPQVPSASQPRAVPTGRAHQMARVSSPFSVPREQLSKPPPLPLESACVLLLAGPRGSGRHAEQGHGCVTSGGPHGCQGDAAMLSAALVRAQVSGRRALPPRGHGAGVVTAQVRSPRRCGPVRSSPAGAVTPQLRSPWLEAGLSLQGRGG